MRAKYLNEKDYLCRLMMRKRVFHDTKFEVIEITNLEVKGESL